MRLKEKPSGRYFTIPKKNSWAICGTRRRTVIRSLLSGGGRSQSSECRPLPSYEINLRIRWDLRDFQRVGGGGCRGPSSTCHRQRTDLLTVAYQRGRFRAQ